MKYTMDTAVTEIAARSKRLRKRREKRTVQALSASCLVLTALLVRTMSAVCPKLPDQLAAGTYGSLLFGETIGSYALTAVIAFCAAVAATMLVMRRRDGGTAKEHGQTGQEGKNEE